MKRKHHKWPRTTPKKRDLRYAAIKAWLRARAGRGKPGVYPDKAVVGNRLVKLYYRGEFLGLWSAGMPGRMTWTEPCKPMRNR